MSRNYFRDDPIADAHDYANREIPSRGYCVVCNKAIPTWDIYYDTGDELIHDDCIFDWLKTIRKEP